MSCKCLCINFIFAVNLSYMKTDLILYLELSKGCYLLCNLMKACFCCLVPQKDLTFLLHTKIFLFESSSLTSEFIKPYPLATSYIQIFSIIFLKPERRQFDHVNLMTEQMMYIINKYCMRR